MPTNVCDVLTVQSRKENLHEKFWNIIQDYGQYDTTKTEVAII